MMKIQTIRLVMLALLCTLLLISACAPLEPYGGDRRITATLLTAGEDVRINGRNAVNGEAIRSGDWITTGTRSSAMVEFSGNTSVQIIDADVPVYLNWNADELTIRMDDGAVDVDKGDKDFSLIKMIGRLAEFFSWSRFIAEEQRVRFFRIDLLFGRMQMLRPRQDVVLAPGQYSLVTTDRQVEVGQTSPQWLRAMRSRFDRWKFQAPRPTRANPVGQGVIDLIIKLKNRSRDTTPDRTPDAPPRGDDQNIY
ncbi:hypothetical protein [Marinobacterium rhizophilum]|uniref:hypothetical protein n=1 Tax=Marinobacterium rhizophilum TaxID=420402 RepID=UPI0003828987|nr:hypothetical protein [Marinobacterium rhizophilum]